MRQPTAMWLLATLTIAILGVEGQFKSIKGILNMKKSDGGNVMYKVKLQDSDETVWVDSSHENLTDELIGRFKQKRREQRAAKQAEGERAPLRTVALPVADIDMNNFKNLVEKSSEVHCGDCFYDDCVFDIQRGRNANCE